MSRSLCWHDLTKEHITELASMKTRPQRLELLAKLSDVLLPENGAKPSVETVLMDFYCENLEYCLENKLAPEKTSTFFSIMKEVHFQSMDPDVTLVESFGKFTKLLVSHSVHRPPFSVEIFSQSEVQLLSKYVHNTYYRHFKMYQYVFCPKQVAVIISKDSGDLVELPMICKPLAEALPEEEYLAQQQKQREEAKALAEQEKQETEQQAHLEQTKSPTPVPQEETKEESGLEEELDEKAGEEPQLPHPYIQRQLNQIKEMLSQMADSRFGEIESRIQQIEQALPSDGKDPKNRSDSRKGGAVKPKK